MITATISDAAHALDVSTDTIRRWDKQGLIKSKRDQNNYRVFNLVELERVRRKLNGESDENHYTILKSTDVYPVTCVDLFAGAGGTALGFAHAGIQHSLLSEIDRDACSTLRENSAKQLLGWQVAEGDVADIDFSTMKPDIIQAGFPCQAFSYAGNSQGFEDTRGTLFFQFARAIKESRPKLAIGENVRGLMTHDGGRTIQTMMNTLDELGYNATYRILRAQYLDVPQKRERLIIMSSRKDLDLPLLFPRERDYLVTLREALEGCPQSPGQKYSENKKRIMDQVPEGGYWRDLTENDQREYMGASYFLGGGKTGMARRLSWNQPSLTLTCNPAQKQTERCHPSETRPLTVREYARIQTFPDDWAFTGSLSSQYRQIGNAVPVNMAYHVARCALASLGCIEVDENMVSHQSGGVA